MGAAVWYPLVVVYQTSKFYQRSLLYFRKDEYDILQYHIHLNTLKLLHYIVLKYTFKI